MNASLHPALCVLLLLGLAGCHPAETARTEPEPKFEGNRITLPAGSPAIATLKTTPARPAGPERQALRGRLVWDERVTARIFPPFAGRVERIETDASQRVEAGAVLALIAAPDYAQSVADAAKAESDAAQAERTHARLRALLEHGAAAQKDLQAAEADLSRARAERTRAAATLRMRGLPLGPDDVLFPLRSPIAGIVVERNLTPGQEVRPDQMLANAAQFFAPLVVVSDPTRLWVQIDATERELPLVKAGAPFTLRSGAYPDRTFPGEVEWVAESLDAATRMLRLRGRVANPDRLLKAEMFVSVELESGPGRGVEVPLTAVVAKGERQFAFVATRPGVYERRQIRLGRQRGETIIVVEGLAPGDAVVNESSLLLEGMFAEAGVP